MEGADQCFAQGGVCRASLWGDAILFADVLDGDDGTHGLALAALAQMKSEKPLSVFLKTCAAATNAATVMAVARASAFQWNGVENSAARHPSMIGDIGLRYSSQRRCGGTMVDGTTTDEPNNQS